MSQRFSDAALRGYQFDSSDRGQLAADLESLRAAVRRVHAAEDAVAKGTIGSVRLLRELENTRAALRAEMASIDGGAS